MWHSSAPLARAHKQRSARPALIKPSLQDRHQVPSHTPPSIPQAPGEPLTPTRRRSVKGALVALVLGMLGLLLWQLQLESRQLLDSQRQLNHEFNAQLANHLSLSMALKAQASLAMLHQKSVLPSPDAIDENLSQSLQGVFTSLRSVASLGPHGNILADTQPQNDDGQFLAELIKRSNGSAYHYAFNPNNGGLIYLLLRQDQSSSQSNYWLVRLTAEALRSWLHETV
jgi:hypothetical protein